MVTFNFNLLDGKFTNIQLDIVGFLAILGEGSVLANAQVATLSKWFFVPRLLPAPQALLRPSRPGKLETENGFVTGVYSGNHKEQIYHIGNVLLNDDNLDDFSVRCVEVTRNPKIPNVKAKTFAPLTALSIFGAALAIFLLIFSIFRRDGMAFLATLLLSCLSTLIGVGNKWTLNLPQRRVKNWNPPPGDVVIRYPKGAFLVVKCQEDVARELYFAPEGIEYLIQNPATYRLMSLVGTLMLMVGVITLGNSSGVMQIAFAVAFMALNAAYWIVAALPARTHWDTSCFSIEDHGFERQFVPKRQTYQEPSPTSPKLKERIRTHRSRKGSAPDVETGDANRQIQAEEDDSQPHDNSAMERDDNPIQYPPAGKITAVSQNETFTQALWNVIFITQSTHWVRVGNHCPNTDAWNDWLKEAKEVATRYHENVTEEVQRAAAARNTTVKSIRGETITRVYEIPNWDPQKRIGELVAMYSDDGKKKDTTCENA